MDEGAGCHLDIHFVARRNFRQFQLPSRLMANTLHKPIRRYL
jgi:hypothetical protein